MLKAFLKNKNRNINDQRGMTLIELLVVLAIFVVVTSAVMFNYNGFRSSASTQNLVNDIALSIRKAQSAAIGVQGLGLDFQYGHGAHFSLNTDQSNRVSGSIKSFILFTDINNDNMYQYSSSGLCGSPTSEDECSEVLSINGSDKIATFYIDGAKKLSGTLNIVFRRPNPDAVFCYKSNSTSACQGASNVKIEVTNDQDPNNTITKDIIIWNTGQISI